MNRLECDRMFMAVMEAGSFIGGARQLGTSSGQASKLVSRLETELDVRLLNRTTRSVSPTEAGQAYHDRLRVLIEELDRLDSEIRNISQTPRGRLRVAAPLTFGIRELAPALNDFAARYPEIELEVNFSDRAVNLVDDGFDLAVRVGQPDDSSLIIRKLCSVRIVVVGAQAYLDRNPAPETPADLARHDCIIDTNFRDPRRRPSGDAPGVAVSGRLRFSNAEVCLMAAEAGLGLACVPAFVAGDAIRGGRVVPLLQDFEAAPYDIFLLYPHSRHLAAKVRLLVEALVERYRDTPHWERGW